MGRKFGTNTKAEEGRARKAAINEEKKKQVNAQKELEVAKKWQEGSYKNIRREEEEAKRLERIAKKKEREELERKERAELDKMKCVKKQSSPQPSSPSIIRKEKSMAVDVLKAAASDIKSQSGPSQPQTSPTSSLSEHMETYSASNVDDALSLLDSLTIESSNTSIDRHPERRMKAAYSSFEEREMPIMKKENPGLRHSQLKERLFRMWQKSPDNPLNQMHISHKATREEEMKAIKEQAEQELQRFRTTSTPSPS